MPSSSSSSSPPPPPPSQQHEPLTSLPGYVPGDAIRPNDADLLLPHPPPHDGYDNASSSSTSLLRPNDCAFVRRSDGSYTYAICRGLSANNDGIVFVVDGRGCFKVVPLGKLAERVKVPMMTTTTSLGREEGQRLEGGEEEVETMGEGIVRRRDGEEEEEEDGDDDDYDDGSDSDLSYDSDANNSTSSSSSSSSSSSLSSHENEANRIRIIERTMEITKSICAKDLGELLHPTKIAISTAAASCTTMRSTNNNGGLRSSTSRFSVLIVEDTVICAKFLTMQLARMDCETCRAENGREAVELLGESPPDRFGMVLMDLRMPVMDGIEATRRIRNVLGMKDLPVVALTGEMMDGCRSECEGVGFDDFFQKPMKRDKLEELINKYRDRNRNRNVNNGGGDYYGGGGGGGGDGDGEEAGGGRMSRRGSSSSMVRFMSSTGLVRTTSGTSVRDLIRRHRSRQSMENMSDAAAAAAAEGQPPTSSSGGGGFFDLARPPPRGDNRSAEDGGSDAFFVPDVDTPEFDPTMPLSVLIVEDTDVCAKFLTMQLQRMNCTTYRCENGEVATDLLRESLPGTFDLVLMDLRMPVMDGLDATRYIKNKLHLKDLPVVALTGEMIEGCRAECEGIGFDDFFQKPMKKDKLEELINRYKSARVGRHRPHPNGVNDVNAAGLVRTTRGTNVGGLTLRPNLHSANDLKVHGSVNIIPPTLTKEPMTRRSTSMRRSTSYGRFNGQFGGQLGSHRLSIDQQLQDPNLKIFTNTVLTISASRNSVGSLRSYQQLDSNNSASRENRANASWEVSAVPDSLPARHAKQQSELESPTCQGRVTRVASGETTSVRSAHSAPNPSAVTSNQETESPEIQSAFALSRDRSVSSGRPSNHNPATAMMPRNNTLQRITENDALAPHTNGGNASGEVSPTNQHPDLANFMSKMVTSNGLGGGNIRMASVQDFREVTTAPNPSSEFLSKLALNTPGSQSGRRSVSTDQFYATGIMPRNVTMQRINEDANGASGANALWHTAAGNGGAQNFAPLNDNPLLRMVANRGSNSSTSSNTLLAMMSARQSQGNVAQKQGGVHSNSAQDFQEMTPTQKNPLLAMMAARQPLSNGASKQGGIYSDPSLPTTTSTETTSIVEPEQYSIGDRVRPEDMPKLRVPVINNAMMVSRLKVNDGAFVFLPEGAWCYAVLLRKNTESLTFQICEDGDTWSYDSLNAGTDVRILGNIEMTASLSLPTYNDDGWRERQN